MSGKNTQMGLDIPLERDDMINQESVWNMQVSGIWVKQEKLKSGGKRTNF